MKDRIGVFFGGNSLEHEISIISAIQVIKALDKEKYEVFPIYVTKDNLIYYSDKLANLDFYSNLENLKKEACKVVIKRENNQIYLVSDELKYLKKKIDLIIPVFHGKGVEDGTIKGYLDFLKVPSGANSVVSASLCQDKVYTKMILENNYFNVLEYEYYYKDNFDINKVNLDFPLIVKPATLGSSIAISIVHDSEELKEAVELAFNYDYKVVIERALENFKEVNCSVLRTKKGILVSSVEEVFKSDEILSYKDKYLSGSMENIKRIIPATLKSEQLENIEELSRQAYELFECSGIVRIDYLVDSKSRKVYLNEINSIPGSLAFYLWEEKDLRFDKLLDLYIEQIKEDYHQNSLIVNDFDNMRILKNIKLNK